MLLWLTILFGWFPASACCARSRPPFPHLRIRGSVNLTPRLSRLTQEALFNANNIPAGTITHAYDAVCNRTSRMVQGLGATVDPIANQNLAFDQRDLILGPNGNPMHDLYDAENRLISRGGGQLTIGYDEDGHRVFETSGGATTVFLVDDRNPTGYSQVLAEYPGGTAGSSANAPTVTYTYGLELIAQNRSGVVRFYGYDGQGSVRLLTDANTTPPIQLIPQAFLLTAGYDGLNGSGALPSANAQATTGPPASITDTYDYDAYGQLLAQTGSTPNNYRYTGQAWDPALGMYHLRARYYQPGLGRFWTMDSFEGDNDQPASLHKFLYCMANSANRFDPTGHNADGASTEASVGIVGNLASRAGYVVFKAMDFANRIPKLTKIVLLGQTLLTWYGVANDPEQAALYVGTGGIEADLQLLRAVANDLRGVAAMYMGINSAKQAVGAVAILTQASIKGGSRASEYILPPGWGSLPAADRARGHLLAKCLGGEGTTPENLVAVYQTANERMKTYEMQVKRAVDSGEKVEYAVIPRYGSNLYPASLFIYAKGDRGLHISAVVANIP